ncbi:unnamed protein product, partial [Musa acuminata subsp. burmannicoides]
LYCSLPPHLHHSPPPHQTQHARCPIIPTLIDDGLIIVEKLTAYATTTSPSPLMVLSSVSSTPRSMRSPSSSQIHHQPNYYFFPFHRGFMVTFAGRKYAARSSSVFVGNSSYAPAPQRMHSIVRWVSMCDGRVGAMSDLDLVQ